MSILSKLLYLLGLRKDPGPQYYRVETGLQARLYDLASQEGLTETELVQDLLESSLQQISSEESLSRLWNSLSSREQEVTALVCLGYTNPQVAARLGISAETVKTHLSSILFKLNRTNRKQIRNLFQSWDFSDWAR